MSTPPNDPFANPENQPSQTPAGNEAPPPRAPAPGMIPGAAPQHTPPPVGASPSGWAPEPPRGLALWTIILTGAVALLSLVGALMTPAQIESLKDTIEAGDTPTQQPGTLLGLLSGPVLIASYVVLAMWMAKIRSNRTARGEAIGGPPAVEWWGWLVPVANFVLPFLGMRAITKAKVGAGVLLGWWLPWCAYWVASFASAVPGFAAVDFETGEISNADAFDALIPIGFATAAFAVISWVFLVVIVRTTTARHLED